MGKKSGEFAYAFPKTVPVMVGYLFLGMAYGILMKVNGFGIVWSGLLSLFVFGGSLQYLGITMLGSPVNPVTALLMSLMLSARHLFYGISMLGKYGGVKKFKNYLVFGLTDETFSILCSEDVPGQYDKEMVYFWVTVLDHFYWVAGSLLGAVAGSFLKFDTTGLDYALTALFITIFTDQWRQKDGHFAALVGVLASVGCLCVFGRENYIVPAMAVIFLVLGVRYRKSGHTGEGAG